MPSLSCLHQPCHHFCRCGVISTPGPIVPQQVDLIAPSPPIDAGLLAPLLLSVTMLLAGPLNSDGADFANVIGVREGSTIHACLRPE